MFVEDENEMEQNNENTSEFDEHHEISDICDMRIGKTFISTGEIYG